MIVVDSMEIGEIKTKAMAENLKNLKAPQKTLVVDASDNQELRLSLRNMESNQFLPPEGVNVYDLLRHKNLVVSKDAVKAIEARCLGASNGTQS
jgi:large subunit ribosomal protein L4